MECDSPVSFVVCLSMEVCLGTLWLVEGRGKGIHYPFTPSFYARKCYLNRSIRNLQKE